MKRFNRYILLLCIVALSVSGCQNVKEGLSGQKKKNSDEFLIEKKNPLVLPPEFDELPEPKILNSTEKNKEKEIDLEKIIKKKSDNSESISKENNNSIMLEKSILEKIKKN